MIEIKNVSKQFKEKTKKNNIILADDNISLKVPNGSIVGVLGPNGAGKTTLLRMSAGILTPPNGTILYDVHISDVTRIIERNVHSNDFKNVHICNIERQ